jgi:hypothetical protein
MTEHGAFLDGREDPALREGGSVSCWTLGASLEWSRQRPDPAMAIGAGIILPAPLWLRASAARCVDSAP